METTEHDDFVTIVDIPRLILMKSGKMQRNKNIPKAEKLKPESDNNPVTTKTNTMFTLPPINGHLQPAQADQDKKRRMVTLWTNVCHHLMDNKRNKSSKYRIKQAAK